MPSESTMEASLPPPPHIARVSLHTLNGIHHTTAARLDVTMRYFCPDHPAFRDEWVNTLVRLQMTKPDAGADFLAAETLAEALIILSSYDCVAIHPALQHMFRELRL